MCGRGTAPGGTATTTSTPPFVDGVPVSATDVEAVLRTVGGERRFRIRPEDRMAFDPDHFAAHVGDTSIGYRVYYETVGTVDYALRFTEARASETVP